MANSAKDLLAGTEVDARGLRWEVVSSESLGPQTLFRLRGLENAVLGREIDILHPFEDVEPVMHELRPDRAAPLVNWLVYHQAFLLEQALGPHALLAVQPGRLRIEPYQLVPVLRAIRMSRARLFLCDGVGLGKTIEAGLVLTELLARRLAHRILIVSPAGPLLEQWKTEMSQRFGLRLEVIDRAKLDEVRRGTELGSNPFDHIPLGLVSVDFLKQERVLEYLDRASYDAVVIDEAHHCTDAGGGQDREDSQRRRLAEVLARRCDSLLLLTATPHDGNDRSFASLCELLDPSLVDGRGTLRGELYHAHIVRRLKKHILVPDRDNPGKKKSLFPERIVTPVAVTPNPTKHAQFIELQKGLLDLLAPELRRAFRNKTYSDVLAFIALLKRSVSTVAACKATLAVVSDRFQKVLTEGVESQESRRQRRRTLREYLRKQERFGTVSNEEETERMELEAEDLVQQLAEVQRVIRRGTYQAAKVSDIVEHLERLIDLAGAAESRDPKLEQLVAEITAIRAEKPKANVLVYTEYVDSQRAVVQALKAVPGMGTVLTMCGDDTEKDRIAITERFRQQHDIVLVSTDAAAEGLNLQQRCHHLIHLELPFNPNRLEQRNGRIDRYGQTQNPIVRYLFLRSSFEDRILLRLIAKYERQRARLTFVPNTLGVTAASDTVQVRLLKGLMDEDAKLFRDEPALFDFKDDNENEGTDEATRELLEEIDRSLKGFEQTARANTWLGDAGLGADEAVAREATEARTLGQRAGTVDLAAFVCDAVRLDGGQVTGSIDDLFQLRLPPAWCHGLEDLPGYDATSRTVRLTTELDVTSDTDRNPVGYLGRAHPLVRRALERVRNLSFGGMAKDQDPRASAAKADVPEPTLLHTFLGRVSSRAGRELERVLAVKVAASGEAKVFDAADQWASLADPARAVRTTDLWKDHFQDWADGAGSLAEKAALDGFRPIAGAFVAEQTKSIASERANQHQWIAKRAEEITTADVVTDVQRGLFEKPAEAGRSSATPSWQALANPAERLAAFAADGQQPPPKRSEADGVLRIYRQRVDVLDRLAALGEPEVIPLGVLMLIPEEAGRGV